MLTWRENAVEDKDIHIAIQKMMDYFVRYYAISNYDATAYKYAHEIVANTGFVTADEENGRLFLYALYPMNFVGIVNKEGRAVVWDYVQKLMKEKVGVEIAMGQFKIDDIHGIDIHDDTLDYLESTWQMVDDAMTFEQAFLED